MPGTDAAAPVASTPLPPRALKLVLAALMLGMVLSALDQSIVNTALPRITSDLGSVTSLSWVVTAFLLVSTIVTPVYGKLGDMYGRRPVFVAAILLFVLGSLLCGASRTIGELVGARALQGLGAGGLMTLSQTIIADVVPLSERGKYQGLFTASFAISNLLGPLIGGALTSALSWRWVFYVNVPLGALVLGLILIALPPVGRRVSHRIDIAGAVLLAAASSCALLLLSAGGTSFGWTSPAALGLGVAAPLLFGLFIAQERKASEPIIDLNLFRLRPFATGTAATGAMSLAMTCALIFVPLYFQLIFGLSPAMAGLMLLPQIVTMMVSSIVGGRWSSRRGRVKPFLIVGVALEFAALALLALFAWLAAPLPAFLIALAVLGTGMGIGMPNAVVLIQASVPATAIGVATASMAFVRSLGGAVGAAIGGGLWAMQVQNGLVAHGLESIQPEQIGDMLAIARLPAPMIDALHSVYRSAIATSFSVSALVMLAAVALVRSLPPERPTDAPRIR